MGVVREILDRVRNTEGQDARERIAHAEALLVQYAEEEALREREQLPQSILIGAPIVG